MPLTWGKITVYLQDCAALDGFGFFFEPTVICFITVAHICGEIFLSQKKRSHQILFPPLEENVEICGLLHWLNIKLLQLCLPLVLTNFIAFIFSVVGFKWRLHMLSSFWRESAVFAAAILHQILSGFKKEIQTK